VVEKQNQSKNNGKRYNPEQIFPASFNDTLSFNPIFSLFLSEMVDCCLPLLHILLLNFIGALQHFNSGCPFWQNRRASVRF